MRNRARRDQEAVSIADDAAARSRADGVGATAVGTVVVGYRVFRRLGWSERADVYLGVTCAPEQPAARPPVALKIFRAGTATDVIEREFRVLTESRGGSFASLVDVATLSDGRVCFVQEHLSGVRLSRLLGDGRLLVPGEAVTILAPVSAALARLHSLGYVHEGLAQSSIIFDSAGRPVLTGLGRLRVVPPPGAERSAMIDEAVRRVSAFTLGVLDRVESDVNDRGPNPAGWLGSISPGTPLPGLLDELERRLFAWAPASAVAQWAPAPPRGRGQVAPWTSLGRLRGQSAPGAQAGCEGPRHLGGGGQREAARAGGFGAVRARLGEVGRRLRDLRLRVRVSPLLDVRLPDRLRAGFGAAVRTHRGPLLVCSLVAVALSVLLLTFGTQPDARGGPSGEPALVGTAGRTATPDPTSDSSVGPSSAPIAEPADAASDRAAIEGDEPVLAVQVLLRVRMECLRSASAACLAGVDQAGSAALAADGLAVLAAEAGDPVAAGGEAARAMPALVERRGDVALVAVVLTDASAGGDSKPASVLVVKGEAGWRIRQIFDF